MARKLPADLPDEVLAAIGPHLEPDVDMLAAIGLTMAAKRDEAKKARSESGIELAWLMAEEAYVGIDDANRHEFSENRWVKPWNPDGPLTRETPPPGPATQSTVFVRLTARYVDAGFAKLAEILLPLDDKAFKLTETPVPEIISAKDDQSQVVLDHLPGAPPAMRAAEPQENPAGQSPPVAMAAPTPGGAVLPDVGAVSPAVPLTVGDLAKEKIARMGEKAKKAETRIHDWLTEGQYTAEARKALFDSARAGVGVLKGPIAKARRGMAVLGEGDKIRVEIKDQVKPVAKWVDFWNVFPAPGCGEVIRDGDHCFERDWLSERQLRNLRRQPGYIRSQIRKVIAQGPKGATSQSQDAPGKLSPTQVKSKYEVWYYYGTLTREEMVCICMAAGKVLTKAEAPDDQVFAIVTMVNDEVIRATLNPLDSGELPYHNFPWQRRAGHWAGIGIGEQIQGPQRMVNAATRAMLNNAGKSAGSQIVVDRSCVLPADGQWVLTPDKIWYKNSDDNNFSVEQAFALFQIPNTTPELLQIIQYAMRLAEETTSIPLITQGQTGPTQPDTFGAAQLQNNNANQLLRSIGYNWDDFVTEPMIQQFYEWLLLDPDVPADEKGDFQIDAKGSAALIERAIQDQMLVQMLAVSKDPAYGLDPRATMDEFLKSKRFRPQAFKRPKEEQDKIDAQPPAKAPQVQAAEIRAATEDKKLAVTKEQGEAELTLGAYRVRDEAAARQRELENEVQALKVKLAETAMELAAQKQLAGLKAEADARKPETTRTGRVKPVRSQRRPVTPQVATPAVEPPQRAPAGQAFQQ